MVKKRKVDKVKILQSCVNDLLRLMGVVTKAEVSEDKKNELLLVNLGSSDENGLLIGKKGETINSIQTVLGLMLKQKTGEWYRVQVDIGDWRKKQEDYLKSLADKTAQRAKETGQPQTLYNLNAMQRRVIHMEVSNIGGVTSESVGEGKERYMIVKPE